jgi:glutamate--cysteine ligase
VLLAGLIEDGRARAAGRAILEPHQTALPELLRRSAIAGLRDPVLGALAAEVWQLALEGAGRLPPGYLDADGQRQAADFLDRYTLRGRCPADELREALAAGPAAALAWASEPVPNQTVCL